MEHIDNLIHSGIQNKLSNSQKPSLTKSSVSPDEYHALWTLINKSRLLNGWMTRPMDELDDTIETWLEMFNHYKIPVDAYRELYQRAFEFRQHRIRQGQDCPAMDCTLLVAQWTGDHGLAAQRRNTQKIGADKQLYGECYVPKCSWCLDEGKILVGPRRGEICPHRD